MTSTREIMTATTNQVPPTGIVDCDLHNVVPGYQALLPYLTPHWRERLTETAFQGPTDTDYPAGMPLSARAGATPEGGPAGSSLELLRAQALEGTGVAIGVLACAYGTESLHNPDAAAAMAAAVNDWQVEHWLDPEPRLRASIVVPIKHPEDAAREIDRVAPERRFVQVLLPARSEAPYGNRRYLPVFQAASRHGLVVALHYGGAPGNPPTPSGWTSHYIQDYAGMAHVLQTQLMSLIVEGVFDRFPETRLALLECGVSWLPSFTWRLDKEWKGLRREVPWVRRPPSEYVRRHVRLATEPLDAPDFERLAATIRQIGGDEMLLYSSDYPHEHGADTRALLDALPEASRRKIMGENARAFYRL